MAPPRCPKCGCNQVRTFDLVPLAYSVTQIGSDGTVEIDADRTPAQITDESRFDGLRCRGCDYETKRIKEFYAWASEQEHAESLVGAIIQTPDDKQLRRVARAFQDAGHWWVGSGGRWRLRPHEVVRVDAGDLDVEGSLPAILIGGAPVGEPDFKCLRALLQSEVRALVAARQSDWKVSDVYSTVRLLDRIDRGWRERMPNTAARLSNAGLRWFRSDELVGQAPTEVSSVGQSCR
jgi:hypothetical protein